MSIRLQVECVVKTDRYNPHERIQYIGGKGWQHSQPEVIINIESGTHQYFVHQAGVEVEVIVATHNGHKYIKTRNDGIQPDNLLALAACPVG